MTPPTRFRFFLGSLNGIISQITAGNASKTDSMILIIQSGRFRNLLGGVMTPPYEGGANQLNASLPEQ